MSIGGSARMMALGMCASILAVAQPYDLVLHGGHVLDPGNDVDALMDIAVAGSRVAAVERQIPASKAKKNVDVSGMYVVPGLIDLHAHVFGYAGSIFPDDSALPAGTTTIVDAGGSGWRTFDEFRRTIIGPSRTRVLALLNIVGAGMVGEAAESNMADMDSQRTAAAIEANRDVIVGIKTAHFGGKGWTAIDRAVAAGRLAGVPVMVDSHIFTNSGRTSREELLDHMRPGDIHTHLYNDRQVELVNRFTGAVQPWMVEARRRGVLFDMGHGAGSFLWPVATRAMAQGFVPDTISTDLHSASILGPQSDMPNCISKMMLLGMSLPDAVRRSTLNPAKEIGRFPEIGTLGIGRTADIAVLAVQSGVFALKDSWGAKRLAKERVQAAMTIRAGQIVFDNPVRVSSAASEDIYDLLLKNGNVIDPATHRTGRFDVAVIGKKIARIAHDLPAAHARVVVDASSYYVIPGLIDIDTKAGSRTDYNTLPDGVTTAIGSGARTKVRLIPATNQKQSSGETDKSAVLLARPNMMAAMSKSLSDGISLEQVIERATVNPARAIRRDDLGSLAEGAPADIAVLAMESGVPQLRCILTVRDGSILWDSDGLAATDWIKMGPYSNFK